jgi:hypothetical protein
MYIPDYKGIPRENKTLRINPYEKYNYDTKQLKSGFCTYCFNHRCPDNDVAKNKGLLKQKGFRKLQKREINDKINGLF